MCIRDRPYDEEGRALNSDLAVASFTWEPTKAYLKNLNYQYQNGLVDPDFYLDTDGNQSKSNFVAGKAATYACYINAGTQENVIDPLLEQNPDAEMCIRDRIRATPTPLLKDENQRITILENRVVDGSVFDTTGVHSIATGRTIMSNRWSLKKNGFGLTFNKNF